MIGPDQRTLLLIRHTDTGLSEKLVGHWDVPLSEEGLRQRDQLAHWLESEIDPDLVCSSDLQRTKETAQPFVARGSIEIQTLTGLRERDFGDWQGKHISEIGALEPTLSKGPFSTWPGEIPGGEPLTEMIKRVVSEWQKIWKWPWKSLVMFAHGGVNRVLLGHFLGMPESNLSRIAQRFGAVNRIEFFGDVPRVTCINQNIFD